MTPSAPARLAPAALLPYLLAPGLALLLRRAATRSLDLRGTPGPAGVKMLAALAEGDTHRDPCTLLIATVQSALHTDPLAAMRLVMDASGVACALAAVAAGHALAGWRVGLAAGLLAACWSPAIFTTLLLSADAPSTALTWLGVAACWAGARAGWRGLPLAVVGVGLALYGAHLKIVALPAAAYIAVAPLLVPTPPPARRWATHLLRALLAAGLGGLLVWGARQLTASDDVVNAGSTTLPSLAVLWAALQRIPPLTSEVSRQLLALGALGALWPLRRARLARLLLLPLALGVLAFTAHTVDQKLRLRYLVPAGLAPLVLGGAVLGGLAETARRWRLGPLGWLPTILVCLGLTMDSIAWLEGWSNLRSRYTHTTPPALPHPPAAYLAASRYLPIIEVLDPEVGGSTELVAVVAGAPAGGVAGIPLFDAREYHLRALAGLSGTPVAILEPRRCCQESQASDTCARRLVSDLAQAGGRLVLPSDAGPGNRVPHQHTAWGRMLRTAAEATLGTPRQPDPWWLVWDSPEPTRRSDLPCRIQRYTPAPGRPRR